MLEKKYDVLSALPVRIEKVNFRGGGGEGLGRVLRFGWGVLLEPWTLVPIFKYFSQNIGFSQYLGSVMKTDPCLEIFFFFLENGTHV